MNEAKCRALAVLVMIGLACAVVADDCDHPTRDELGAMLVAADDYIEELEYELAQGCEHEGE